MLNYKRRKRQANENSDLLIQKFAENIQSGITLYPGTWHINNEDDLMVLISKLQTEVQRKAGDIESDWSIPIILEAIGRMYYGRHRKHKIYGPIFKRALVYLWNFTFNKEHLSSHKNLESVLEVLRLCYVMEGLYGFRKFFLIDKNFSLAVKEGYIIFDSKYTSMILNFSELLRGRGRRMRIAEVNSQLMCREPINLLSALESVLKGKEPDMIHLFKDTFYAKIPGISDPECQRFWQTVYFRYLLYLSTTYEQISNSTDFHDVQPEITLFPEFYTEVPEGFFTQEIVKDTFWTQDWVKIQNDEVYNNLIVERPVLRITPDGDFATCSVLIGDSINYFIEGQIMKYSGRSPHVDLPASVFKEAVSEPFENRVINEFRKNGFLAGHVTEDGIWITQDKNIDLNHDSTKLYGEIDVLAYLPSTNDTVLIECKVLNDVRDYRSYRNMISKLVDESEGFQAKIRKKSRWINCALSQYLNTEISAIKILLTDIPLPVVNFPAEDILFTWYNRLFCILRTSFEEIGYPTPMFSEYRSEWHK